VDNPVVILLVEDEVLVRMVAADVCRRQIEMSPLAQIEMSLSLFWVCREREADDGDLHEPPGD
jgi:hypothetical protein